MLYSNFYILEGVGTSNIFDFAFEVLERENEIVVFPRNFANQKNGIANFVKSTNGVVTKCMKLKVAEVGEGIPRYFEGEKVVLETHEWM